MIVLEGVCKLIGKSYLNNNTVYETDYLFANFVIERTVSCALCKKNEPYIRSVNTVRRSSRYEKKLGSRIDQALDL